MARLDRTKRIDEAAGVCLDRLVTNEDIAGSAIREYIHEYIMPTSVHIPRPLLEAVDRKARALGVSRNRLIVRALERELAPSAGWSPGFFEALADVSAETAKAAEALRVSIMRGRRSKRGVRL